MNDLLEYEVEIDGLTGLNALTYVLLEAAIVRLRYLQDIALDLHLRQLNLKIVVQFEDVVHVLEKETEVELGLLTPQEGYNTICLHLTEVRVDVVVEE
jgi:hypothetical protein